MAVTMALFEQGGRFVSDTSDRDAHLARVLSDTLARLGTSLEAQAGSGGNAKSLVEGAIELLRAETPDQVIPSQEVKPVLDELRRDQLLQRAIIADLAARLGPEELR